MYRKHAFITLAATLAVAGCGREEPVADAEAPEVDGSPVALELAGSPAAAEQATSQITDEYMRDIIVEISDDSYEGRGPGSVGQTAWRSRDTRFLGARSVKFA